ncbi:chromosome partitioning protein [Fibrobacteres bacterium R8-0-B4]
MNMKIISILNHKGGVGKTTFTGSIAQALALTGRRVLAIDNDSQHNLSSLLNVGVRQPNILDVYRADIESAPRLFLSSVVKTGLPNLHIATSCGDLLDAAVGDVYHLKRVMDVCGLGRYYDFALIDNAPGLDRLQMSAVNACNEIFVPTELRQFAVDGLVEMERTLLERCPQGGRITKIIPNNYRNVRRHNAFIAALNKMFAGRVTDTKILTDTVFDEVVTEGKILFLHRLYSKGAACYVKLVHELFLQDEEELWDTLINKRGEHIRDMARDRYHKTKKKGGGGDGNK